MTDLTTRHPTLARNVADTWGPTGRHWLDQLPVQLTAVAGRLGVQLGDPFDLTFHWVSRAVAGDGTPVVVKLGPTAGHLDREAEALGIFAGHGAVRLLDTDPTTGALLLERATPGTPVGAMVAQRDVEATAVLLAVMGRLHRPPPPGCRLPTLDGYRAALTGHLRRHPADQPLPRDLVDTAAGLFTELCADAPPAVVLHGDLHHDNVLAATRQPWLAIDPHGVVGDPAYDAAALLYNPDPWRRDQRLLDLVPARIEQLAAGLGTTVDRIVAWGFVQGVLSEVWTAQGDGTPGSRALDVARLLRPRLR